MQGNVLQQEEQHSVVVSSSGQWPVQHTAGDAASQRAKKERKKNLGPNKGKLFKRAELHLADPSLVFATKKTHAETIFLPSTHTTKSGEGHHYL